MSGAFSSSRYSASSPRALWATTAAGAGLFLLFCAELRWSESLGALAPPATLIAGLGLAAGRGSIGATVLAGWAGLLHAAAAGGPPGASLAVAALLAAGLRGGGLAAGRRWLLAGALGWLGAEAIGAAGALSDGGTAGIDWRTLPAAAGLGLVGAGLASAVRGDATGESRRWG